MINKKIRSQEINSMAAHRKNTKERMWEETQCPYFKSFKDKDGGRVRTDFLILDSPHAQFPYPRQKEDPCPTDESRAAFCFGTLSASGLCTNPIYLNSSLQHKITHRAYLKMSFHLCLPLTENNAFKKYSRPL